MARPWHPIPIHDNGEPLLEIPAALLRWQPHPYQALGAPYSAGSNPFQLRQSVVERLLDAQQVLRDQSEPLQLLIFDAFRPLAVQQFMVDHTRALPGVTEEDVMALWAEPSADPATPPPHSTGAAVDLTLATPQGEPLDMGGEIDAVGPIGHPNHFADADPASPEGIYHQRRCILHHAMTSAGFVRHPKEWWHFSWGDQLWAWSSGAACAHYGRSSQA
ncbi:MAG: D-alanyl-D-alanine dipeptidase [Synechococcus sp. H1_metabat_bins_2.tsv.006]|nr:D-alanyl-D-alanine dipeptidase [Synechococcus sp. H1_metabat_bins_2.tsv.006]